MPLVNPFGIDDGEYEKSAEPDRGGVAQAGEAAMALLQQGSHDPEAYAAILRQHPELRQRLIDQLHRRFGNRFVTAVLDALGGARAKTTEEDMGSTGQQATVRAGEDAGKARTPEATTDNNTPRAGVAGMMNEGLDHFDPKQLPEGTRPVSNGEHRAGVIAGIKGMRDGLFHAMEKGGDDAFKLAEERDKPPHVEGSTLLSILGEAVSAVMMGTNATAALWLANKIAPGAGRPEIEFAKNAIKEVLKDSLHSALAKKSSGAKDVFPGLRNSFFTALSREFSLRRQILEQGWSAYSNRLSSLSDEQLEQAHSHAVNAIAADELQARMQDTVLVSWTNFLAMLENGHKGWDLWEKHGGKGAVPTEDASKAPTRTDEDPSQGNIDAARTGNLVSSSGDPAVLPGRQSYAYDVVPSTGVLEVFCDWNGLVSSNYGMTIANVGPQVRERLKAFGRVGKLPVNKNIHIVTSDESTGHDRVYASILITADGYIRKVTGSAAGGPHAERVANLVERVQNLPLSMLRE